VAAQGEQHLVALLTQAGSDHQHGRGQRGKKGESGENGQHRRFSFALFDNTG
jgi:hypothetical protein